MPIGPWSTIHDICSKGDIDGLNNLISVLNNNQNTLTAILNTQENNFHTSPIYIASKMGHINIAKALLDTKVIDFTLADNNGYTPLHTATANGHYNIAFLLCLNGANYHITNHYKQTPADIAVQTNHYDIYQFFLTLDEQNIDYSAGEFDQNAFLSSNQCLIETASLSGLDEFRSV